MEPAKGAPSPRRRARRARLVPQGNAPAQSRPSGGATMTPAIAKRPQRERPSPDADKWLWSGERSAWWSLHIGSQERARQFWGLYRDAVIEGYVEQYPGFRPRLWWDFDAPERRRRVGG